MPYEAKTAIEDKIVRFISDELGIARDDIDLHANLGIYGLESVAASKLIGSLEKDLDVRLSEVLIFEFPTIASLSGEIHKLTLARA